VGERTAVYRLYDAADVLLYVGSTRRPAHRWREHRVDKTWWLDVASKELTWYDDASKAVRAERTAILSENPLHNKARVPVRRDYYQPRVWTRVSADLAQAIERRARRRRRATAGTARAADDALAALIYEALCLRCQPGIIAHLAGIGYDKVIRLRDRHMKLHPELLPPPARTILCRRSPDG